MEKFGLRLTGHRKCYFSIFAFSLFPNFKWLLSKILQRISRVLSNFYYVTNISDLHIFENETTTLLNLFWNLHGYAFCFFISSKWKKHYNPPLDDTFKMYCCAANLNSSSINKPFLNYGLLNMLFRCFF